jgi:predicted small secreted protein
MDRQRAYQNRELYKIVVRRIVALILVAGSFIAAACNTVEGAGRDIESVGEAVKDVAD